MSYEKLVRAKADVFYGGLMRYAGELFNLDAPEHFDPAAHEEIDRAAYLANPAAFDPERVDIDGIAHVKAPKP